MASRLPTDGSWWTVVVWSLVLLIAALIPSPYERHSRWVRFGPDKILHFVGYGGFAVVIANAIDRRRDNETGAAFFGIAVSSVYSHLVGKFQERVPGRKNESADAYAAILGAVVFVTGWFGIDRRDR